MVRTAIRRLMNMAAATSKPFENACGAHAAADTHAHKAVAGRAAPHLIEERRGQPAPGAAEGVPERPRTAVDVHLLFIERQFAEACQHLCRKRFIKLDQIDVFEP